MDDFTSFIKSKNRISWLKKHKKFVVSSFISLRIYDESEREKQIQFIKQRIKSSSDEETQEAYKNVLTCLECGNVLCYDYKDNLEYNIIVRDV